MPEEKNVVRGLEGVIVANTTLSKVMGEQGRLIYRGYSIADLAANASFEEVVYLLWFGELPDADALRALRAELAARRTLPDAVHDALGALPDDAHPMAALRTAVSMLGAFDPRSESEAEADRMASAKRLVAAMPTAVASFERLRRGQSPVAPRDDLDHAANFLYMLHGAEVGPAAVRAVNAYLVLLADHGFNASTFSARVTASTLADLYSAVTSAISTLKGSLHGGANQRVMEMLSDIEGPEAAEQWVLDAIGRKERIMGVGHRVYKTYDPRATVLREMSAGLAAERGDEAERLHETAVAVADTATAYFEEHRPELKIYPNVDFYSAPVLHAAGIPTDQFTPLFALSRVAGWTAHVLEQWSDNRLIRPRAEYVGPHGRDWVPLEDR